MTEQCAEPVTMVEQISGVEIVEDLAARLVEELKGHYFLFRQRARRSPLGRDLPGFPDLRHNKAMEPLFQFTLALRSAGAPWLADLIVVAMP